MNPSGLPARTLILMLLLTIATGLVAGWLITQTA